MYILSSLMLLSCGEGFLEKNDPTKLNSGNFYQTKEHFDQAMDGVYSQLQDYTSYAWWYSEFITDNTTLHFNPGMRGFASGYEAIEYWQLNPTALEISWNIYSSIYSYITNINVILAKLPHAALDEKAKQRVKSEMKFMRAYYYFQLVQFFGDVIIVTDQISNPDDAWSYSRSPIAEVYNLIDDDLTVAVELLPLPSELASSDIGRLTKGAALTLQGRTYLVRKQYVEAINAFKQVTQLGYILLSDYSQVFDPVFKNHKESIMDVQFQGNNDLGEQSGFLYNFYPRESSGAVIPFPGKSGEGWNIPTLDVINDFEDGDIRKDVSLKEGYTNNGGNWVAVPYINKFNHPHTIEGRPNDNWPLMRYAEVLLSLAEAINESEGPTSEAYSYLNQIRSRAGLNPVANLTKEEFRKIALHERRIELVFENHRWFDLKRTMSSTELATFLNAYGEREKANPTTAERASVAFSPGDYEFKEYEAFLPIPVREIRLNPDLKQTDGYY